MAISTASTAVPPLFRKVMADLAALVDGQQSSNYGARLNGNTKKPWIAVLSHEAHLLLASTQVNFLILQTVIPCARVNKYRTYVSCKAASLGHIWRGEVNWAVNLSVHQAFRTLRALFCRCSRRMVHVGTS